MRAVGRGRGVAVRTCRRRVWRRRHGGAHVGVLEPAHLVLESAVAAQELLHRLVAALVAAELVELALQTLNVFLCAGADGALGLAVVGPLARQL